MPRPIIFRIGRLSGLKSRPALIEGPLPQTPLVESSTRRLNNGPAEYDLVMMAGISLLLSATPAPDPQWQTNAAEHQGRTHELALLQSQQFSGLLRAQTPAVQAAANQGRRLTIEPGLVDTVPSSLLKSSAPSQVATNRPRMLVSETPWVEVPESFSYSQYLIEFDAPLLKPRITDPQQPQEFPSQLLRALPTTAPVGINPRILNLPAVDVQAYPSFRIQAQVPLAATSDFRPRILVNAPDSQPDLQSKSFAPRFEPTLVNTRFLILGPDRPQEFPSRLAVPRFEASAVIAGIQPHVLVVQAQDNIDGLFTSASRLVVPNHTEPSAPPAIEKDFFPGVGGAPRYKDRQRKKYLVEIDGQDFYVASANEAACLIAQAQELAEEKAQREFDRALQSTLKLPKLRRVIAHKLQAPVIRVPQAEIDQTAAAIEQQARALQANIAQLYADIARSIEIGVLLRRQLDDDDEEAITVLLL